MAESRLVRWFVGNVPRLARRVTEECRREIPYYAALPRTTISATLLPGAEAVVALVARQFRDGRTVLTAEERVRVVEVSTRRADEGLPLEVALIAYQIGMEVLWREVRAEARPGEAEEQAAIAEHLFGFLRAVVPAVAAAHAQAQQERHNERRDALQMLHGALLAGEPADALAVRAGVELADAYRAVVLRFGAAEVAVTRPIRAFQDVQAALGTPLVTMNPRGVSALLPMTEATAGDALTRMMVEVGRALGRPVAAAVADAADRDGIPAAANEAMEVAELVARLGHPPGLYTLDDVLLEYQLARPGQGLARLAARLDGLGDRVDLFDTLRAFVRQGHNRRLAAQDLHVHRNTLDYRLRVIAQRTGLDAAEPRDAHLLTAALNARDLLGGSPWQGEEHRRLGNRTNASGDD
ncbi:PucR family transcriptional regulator [Thermomonospora umbrina]|uniref:PucR-like helix-turn-helix protein n=1 Tax=Thermomonospora umbrina TaxID=111806 RepID=A0A3D9T0F7_9ACTN|nr:PucR family transcriptional regulator [Thermomonospora umbrina]REE97311.1 PucR-like helix-turn-helix protein [Thermomonospora umbrina]